MRTANSQRCAAWENETGMHDIIYLPQHRTYARKRTYRRRRRMSADALWNIIFGVLCLSVLVVLFLH